MAGQPAHHAEGSPAEVLEPQHGHPSVHGGVGGQPGAHLDIAPVGDQRAVEGHAVPGRDVDLAELHMPGHSTVPGSGQRRRPPFQDVGEDTRREPKVHHLVEGGVGQPRGSAVRVGGADLHIAAPPGHAGPRAGEVVKDGLSQQGGDEAQIQAEDGHGRRSPALGGTDDDRPGVQPLGDPRRSTAVISPAEQQLRGLVGGDVGPGAPDAPRKLCRGKRHLWTSVRQIRGRPPTGNWFGGPDPGGGGPAESRGRTTCVAEFGPTREPGPGDGGE